MPHVGPQSVRARQRDAAALHERRAGHDPVVVRAPVVHGGVTCGKREEVGVGREVGAGGGKAEHAGGAHVQRNIVAEIGRAPHAAGVVWGRRGGLAQHDDGVARDVDAALEVVLQAIGAYGVGAAVLRFASGVCEAGVEGGGFARDGPCAVWEAVGDLSVRGVRGGAGGEDEAGGVVVGAVEATAEACQLDRGETLGGLADVVATGCERAQQDLRGVDEEESDEAADEDIRPGEGAARARVHLDDGAGDEVERDADVGGEQADEVDESVVEGDQAPGEDLARDGENDAEGEEVEA